MKLILKKGQSRHYQKKNCNKCEILTKILYKYPLFFENYIAQKVNYRRKNSKNILMLICISRFYLLFFSKQEKLYRVKVINRVQR